MLATAPASNAEPGEHLEKGSAGVLLQCLNTFLVAAKGLANVLKKDLPASLDGPEGSRGVKEIVSVCDRILEHCRALVRIEYKIRTTSFPSDLEDIQKKCRGLASENVQIVSRMISQMRAVVEGDRPVLIVTDVSYFTKRVADLIAEAGRVEPVPEVVFESEQSNGFGCGGYLFWIGLIIIVIVVTIVAPWWVLLIFFGLCLMADSK